MNMDEEMLERFEVPRSARPADAVERNALVSAMLQDRGVVRLLSAPRGFGKTALAAEYAERLFKGKTVHWVDASSPGFLMALDEGCLLGADAKDALPDLYVLDALPWLHEQRAASLAHMLDTVLYRGAEVVVTTVPSVNSLQDIQPDRILIRAKDLLVTEREYTASAAGETEGKQARLSAQWRQAADVFMGHVPCVVWEEDKSAAAASCLRSFFDEKLPLSAHECALGMLLVEHGSMDDLDALGVRPHSEDLSMLAFDYPFLGLDDTMAAFDMPGFPASEVKAACSSKGLAAHASKGMSSLIDKVLSLLVARGDMTRAEEVLDAFCSDERCASWLMECGWDLLDEGQVELVEAIFARCPDELLESEASLQALKAWTCGLQGDENEAQFFANKALANSGDDDAVAGDLAGALPAYLALAAFAGGATSVYGKGTYAPAAGVTTPMEFLASIVDSCSDVEVTCALSGSEAERTVKRGKPRRNAGKRRVQGIAAAFTEGHDRFKGSLPYRIALHLLQHIESVRLRKLLANLGCDIVVELRRRGLQRFSEAVLVRDLWKNGYFGVNSPAGGARDAVILEQAGRKLKDLAVHRGQWIVDIPWEQRGGAAVLSIDADKPMVFTGNAEVMHVNLLGGLEVSFGGKVLGEGDFRRKSRILFVMLVLNLGRDVSRDSLLEHLWPGFSRVRALDNFYTAWSNIVTVTGSEGVYLERSGEFCRINPHNVVSDVGEFDRVARRLHTGRSSRSETLDLCARLEALYRGDILPNEKEFKPLNAHRDRYKALFVDSMIEASSHALAIDDARLGLWFARRAMDTDSGREDSYTALMRAQIAAGQRCCAIRTYHECRSFLSNDLGLDPSPDTQGLYDQLIVADPALSRLSSETFAL